MNKVTSYYEAFDEWGRLDREPIEFLVNWYFIRKHLPEKGHILDNGAGPGKYAIKLAENGYMVTIADLTSKLVRDAERKAGELGLLERFGGFHTADARDMRRFEDESFDACLMLGPMYHLQTERDRAEAVQELWRVTGRNGIVFVAFMPRVRHMITSLLDPGHWKPTDSADEIARFMANGIFDHREKGRFTGAYFATIEEIRPLMEKNGFETITMIGSSNVASLIQKEHWAYWKARGGEEMEKIVELVKSAAEDPHLLGLSPHIMYIGRKID